MKVGFLTLGCKVNSYETERMKQQFQEAGHTVVSFEEMADAYIVNTCTVTNIADRKSRKMLHRARRKNPEAVVVAAGCYADSAQKKGEADDSIDLFITNEEKAKLVERVTEARLQKKEVTGHQLTEFEQQHHMSEEAASGRHTRAYLKVQDGCNQYCTYCIIPYVRGPLKSRGIQEVVQEAQGLAAAGIREVVVTGIHVSSYGVDQAKKKSFLDLEESPLLELLRALSSVQGIERIRLGSLEPRIITEEFVRELAEIPQICPHFHLSLQSGCDTTLQRMNRRYTTAEYLAGLGLLRKYFQTPAVTTDIIVGFPQETEEEFSDTCAFVREAGFAQIHVFKYSRRQGTMADAMKGQIEEGIKAKRSEILLDIERELEKIYQEDFIGKEEKVLFEEITTVQGQKYLAGYNERYVRIGIPVGEQTELLRNTIGTVCIQNRLTEGFLVGNISGSQTCGKRGCFFQTDILL